MQELYDDNVMYAELRTSLSGFYELDGYVLDPLAAVGIYKETIAKQVNRCRKITLDRDTTNHVIEITQNHVIS